MNNGNNLKKGSLGLWTVVFFVVAAASPLTGVVGAMPLNFMLGNGAGVPGSFIVAALLLIIFSFGFIAMSKYVVNAGAFYTYIVQGLGVGPGISGLSVAILAYTAIQLSVTAMFGFFTQHLVVSHLGIDISWWVYALAMQIVVILLGIARVEIGGKILGLLMILEVGIILLIDIAIFQKPINFEFTSFQPSTIFTNHFGISMVFAICSFIGFEAAAIYSEECINPKKVVSRATFIAVGLIAIFFVFTSWSFILYSSSGAIVAIASKDPGMYVYDVATAVLGKWSVDVMSVLLLTSLFAATQAFHNSLARYMYTISRDGLFWSKLSKTHAKHQTPYIASIVQGIIIMMCIVVFAVMHFDPMIDIFSWCSAFGSMAILALQFGVSLAVISYFIKNKDLKVSMWSRLIAPTISSIGMAFILYLVIKNLDIMSGSNSPTIYIMPIVLFISIIAGLVTGAFLKKKHIDLYNNIYSLVKRI
ncbi:APC family permease [Acinetobacter baumannii]|uniref:Amino acid permease n=1 Tax=Acinetobacter baumannii TaxID=470 RepID=A0A241ZFK3_ACIBA|nr:APC family permease [Acinetobacter baumannii]AHB91323.1 putative amino-acid permease P7G5.06 [Acinetobacter baumannii ZW85-1]EHU1488741.1 APC family permease [Acinetobacter baumannii]ETQ95021.1 amino acid permease [Acinetobacter baumannii UH6507]EXE36652.1 amino acid permease family protein [Acinetobacter baumannii 1546444]MBU3082755.1 APC family permease [Acinetobacter baumannii]